MKEKKRDFDKLVLGDGIEYTSDCSVTGCNNNIAVIGGSGSGKSWSVVLKRIIETKHSNLVVTTAKDRMYDMTSDMMIERGYKVGKLDLAHPEKSTVYWNLLDSLKSWSAVTQFATDIVYANKNRKENYSVDPYWNECSISLFSAMIGYQKCTKEEPDMKDVLEMFSLLKILGSDNDGVAETSLDKTFSEFEKQAGSDHYVMRMWKTISIIPVRTLRCVLGTLSTILDKTFSPDVMGNLIKSEEKEKFDAETFSATKSVLYLNTSPYNLNIQYLLNVFYASLFQNFFEIAENNGGKLNRDIAVILDDFAAGGEGGINGFEQYISTFREAGISVILLLQSEAQLEKIYGEAAAISILDNCDTTIYMGTNNRISAKNVSEKINRPLEEVLYMPIGKEIVIHRGEKPKYYVDRYPILEDPVYKKMIRVYEENRITNVLV